MCAIFALAPFSALADDDGEFIAGPAYSNFKLTLQSGQRQEAFGPFYNSQTTSAEQQLAFPPFFCHTLTSDVGWDEWEFLYPIADYRRFGSEYRWQIIEFLSFSGGKSDLTNTARMFTLFPFYFQRRASDPSLNYTALVPIYGHMENRLFRDDIKFVLFPLYSETRKKDVVTDNYLYPIFARSRGEGLTGWEVWPLVGTEHKLPTTRTNYYADRTEIIGGYDKYFVLFPFFLKARAGIGTTNPATSMTVIPFYNRLKSPARDEISYGWPLGYNIIDDREQKFTERDLFWPFIVRARGSKTVTHYLPFYSHAVSDGLESDFYAWPIYKFNRIHSPPLDRTRTRIFFFVYSDTVEKNILNGDYKRRVDFWPFYTFHRDLDGSRRLQILAPLEPFFPNNRSVTREYSPLWSVWRAERNARTGDASQSLFWNLYRHEKAGGAKKFSLLFGLFQYQSTVEGGSWRIFYCHIGRKPAQPRPKS